MVARKHEKSLSQKLTALSSTSNPRQRLLLARDIQQSAVALERDVVSDARKEGLSWTQIGETLGMSKQAAQQRFKEQSSRPSQAE